MICTMQPIKTSNAKDRQALPLWEAFLEDRTSENRNRLVEYYYFMVEATANRFTRNLRRYASFVVRDELLSGLGLELVFAVERYKPGGNASPISYLFRTLTCKAMTIMKGDRNVPPPPLETIVQVREFLLSTRDAREVEEIRSKARRCLRTMSQREAEVMRMFSNGMSDGVIGNLLGVSHQRVQQIRTSGINKARKAFARRASRVRV